jgi:serine protease Do
MNRVQMKIAGFLVLIAITVGFFAGKYINPTPQASGIPSQNTVSLNEGFLLNAAFAQSLERGFADLAKRMIPGVVNISTFVKPRFQGGFGPGMGGMGGQDELFRRFFEDYFGGQFPHRGNPGGGPGRGRSSPPSEKQKLQPMGLGTGFVIEDSGLILTNHHVIGEADEVKIQFREDDEDLVTAEIIGRDPELDVALLKVKTSKKLTVLPLGDSDAMDVGEYVLAVGNPMGYGHSVTHGILSAKGRKSPEFRLGRYLQTDASINPGNSGGPLINMRGQVIGINNAIDARAQGIGFAIPINLVKATLQQLKTKGSVSRGYLGISVADVTPEVTGQLGLPEETKGVLVAEVSRGEPADRAGLRPYDIITSINGEKISTAGDLTAKVTSVSIGESVKIQYLREGREKSTQAKVGERPSFAGRGQSGPRRLPAPKAIQPKESKESDGLGFAAQDFSEDHARAFRLPLRDLQDRKYVVVVQVEEGKSAANGGLMEGDLILDVAGKDFPKKDVTSVAVLDSALKTLSGKGVMLRVLRYDSQGNDFVTVVILK